MGDLESCVSCCLKKCKSGEHLVEGHLVDLHIHYVLEEVICVFTGIFEMRDLKILKYCHAHRF